MDSIWLSGAEWVAVYVTSLVGLFAMSWQTWSLDHAIGWF